MNHICPNIDYAIKTQKWKAICNCLAIYNRPFHIWWNTNYIAYVQKWKETEKTPASQTWPKRFDTTRHSTPKPVRRIRPSEEWIRSNQVASNPRSLEISLSLLYECRRRTNSPSKLGLEVQICLCYMNVWISAAIILNTSSFLATSTWRRWNANCGSLGSLADPYSRLKEE